MRTSFILIILLLPFRLLIAQAISLNGSPLSPPTTPGAPTSCNDDYEFRNLAVGLPTVSGNCITMTNGALVNGSSAVWICTPLNLTIDFNITFDANFGSNVASGDGIAFVMDGDPDIEMGGDGVYMGYHSINPSVAVEFDTWPDADINCDHAEIHYGGIVNNISNPTPLKPCCGTINDGLDHTICISWDASTSTLRALFDGNVVGQYQGSIATLLGTNSPVWGITTGCGSGGQVQRICNVSMSNNISTVASCPSCTPPNISVLTNSLSICNGESLNLSLSSSSSGTSYCWSAGDNTSVQGETLNDQISSTITDTLTLTSGFTQTVTYTVIAASNGCISPPYSFDVTVSNGINLLITLSLIHI